MNYELNHLYYNGKDLAEFHAYIANVNQFDAPARDVTTSHVPGRNGDLVIDNGSFNNIEVTYDIYIKDNVTKNAEALRNFLLSDIGYHELTDGRHLDEFRKASFISAFDMSNSDRVGGALSLKFNCKPQRWLASGQIAKEYTADAVINNESQYEARPLIRVYGYGSLSIGSDTVTISNYTSIAKYIDIDCELMDAYNGSTNLNSYIRLSSSDFPKLEHGVNGIAFSGSITKVEITPRWWII